SDPSHIRRRRATEERERPSAQTIPIPDHRRGKHLVPVQDHTCQGVGVWCAVLFVGEKKAKSVCVCCLLQRHPFPAGCCTSLSSISRTCPHRMYDKVQDSRRPITRCRVSCVDLGGLFLSLCRPTDSRRS
ncbi:unnamed protein product, partial [Ectocarpus fasciculatus]